MKFCVKMHEMLAFLLCTLNQVMKAACRSDSTPGGDVLGNIHDTRDVEKTIPSITITPI